MEGVIDFLVVEFYGALVDEAADFFFAGEEVGGGHEVDEGGVGGLGEGVVVEFGHVWGEIAFGEDVFELLAFVEGVGFGVEAGDEF